jgi:heavy metal efflux system protein
MLIGGNSRRLSAMLDAKIKGINRTLPPDVEIKIALNWTPLVDG